MARPPNNFLRRNLCYLQGDNTIFGVIAYPLHAPFYAAAQLVDDLLAGVGLKKLHRFLTRMGARAMKKLLQIFYQKIIARGIHIPLFQDGRVKSYSTVRRPCT